MEATHGWLRQVNSGLGVGPKRTRGQIRTSTKLSRLPRAQPALTPGRAEWTSGLRGTQALSFCGDSGPGGRCEVRAELGVLLCPDHTCRVAALPPLATLVTRGLGHVQNYHPVGWWAVDETLLMQLRASGLGRNGTCGILTGGRVEGCGCEESRSGGQFRKLAAGLTPAGSLRGNLACLT